MMSVLRRFDDRVLGVVEEFWRWGALLLVSGWLTGVSCFPVAHTELAGFMLRNDLDSEKRRSALMYGCAGVVVVAAIYVAVWLYRKRENASLRATRAFAEFSRVWFVSLAAAPLSALFFGGLERANKVLALFFIAVVTGLVMAMVHLRPPPAVRERDDDADAVDAAALPPLRQDPQFRIAVLLCLLYGLAMSYLSLVEHWSLGTHAYDLGIYDNLMWNSAHGHPLRCSLSKGGTHVAGHFDPILVLLSPLYWVAPRAESLLVLQSLWIGSAGIPLYLIARRTLPEARGFCVGVVGVFFLHPALHGINLFDFHSLALCVPTVLWCLHCVDGGYRRWFPFFFVLLLLTREDMSLISAFIGIYAITRGRASWGVITIVIAMTYLFCVKRYVMPDPGLLMQASKETSSFIYYYADMIPVAEEGLRGLVLNTFSNPTFVFKVIFLKPAKTFYIVGLFMPLLFLPLLARHKRIMLLYSLVFIGLVTRRYVYSYHFQYSASVLPFLLAAVPEGAKRVTDWAARRGVVPSAAHLRRTILWGMLTCVALLSARFGAFVPNGAFKGGWNMLNRRLDVEDRERYAELRAMVAEIPGDAVVSASSALVPHVSARADVYMYPVIRDADYLLLNVERINRKKKSKAKLTRMRRKYESVREFDGLELLRRVAPKSGEEPTQEYLDYLEFRKREERAERERARQESSKRGRTGNRAAEPTPPKKTKPRPPNPTEDDEGEPDDPRAQFEREHAGDPHREDEPRGGDRDDTDEDERRRGVRDDEPAGDDDDDAPPDRGSEDRG